MVKITSYIYFQNALLFSLQNVMKKIVWNALFFRKKLSASLKNGKPPIKNNGPSLSADRQQQFISISYHKCLFNLITSFKFNWCVLLLRKTISRQRNPLIVFCRMMQVPVYSLCSPGGGGALPLLRQRGCAPSLGVFFKEKFSYWVWNLSKISLNEVWIFVKNFPQWPFSRQKFSHFIF